MIIDFHTHVFPDKIAQKTISLLSEKGGIPAFSDGTVTGLLDRMEKAGVDIAVTLPVVTNPLQFESINRYAESINSAFLNEKRRLISFAGIHPLCEDIDKKMDYIANAGFRGIKIHPDYQQTFINHEGYIKILECARANDLTVITHAGIDVGYRDMPVRCTPTLAKEVIKKVPGVKLVLAHLGASEMPDDVYEILCGEDVYLDTAYVLRFTKPETFKKILKKHGEDRILFATDSPWSDIDGDVEILRSYNLPDTTLNKILYENAKELLKL